MFLVLHVLYDDTVPALASVVCSTQGRNTKEGRR
jgi:hypothetical protein